MELFRGYSRYKCRLVSVISRAATPIPTRRRNVDMPHRRASGLRESFSRGRTVRRGSTSRGWAPARISAGYPIEKMIKMKLGALGIAAFAALNQSLGLVYCRTLDKYHNLFLGRWIKKVAHGAGSLAPGHDACARIHFQHPDDLSRPAPTRMTLCCPGAGVEE